MKKHRGKGASRLPIPPRAPRGKAAASAAPAAVGAPPKMPGPNTFSPDEESAMRGGRPGFNDGDADDMPGGM